MSLRDRIALAVVLSVAVLAASWFGLVAPKRADVARLDKDIAAAETSLQQARAELATNLAAKATYRANYEQVVRLGKAAPMGRDVPSLVYQLERTARRSRVDFSALETAQAGQSAGAALPTLPFSFTFEGDFARLSSFLGRLQRYVEAQDDRLAVDGRLLSVDGFSLALDRQTEPDEPVVAKITATAYYLTPGQTGLEGATPSAPPAAGATPPASGASPAPAPATATATP